MQVGQQLRLTKPAGFVTRRVVAEVAPSTSAVEPRSQHPDGSKPASRSGVATPKAPYQESAAINRDSGKPAVPSQNAYESTKKITWSWPLRGKVIRHFSPSSTQQGVDISANSGEVVRVSAAGEVVYVGNSLKGYGNLIIVKHNDSYLSLIHI